MDTTKMIWIPTNHVANFKALGFTIWQYGPDKCWAFIPSKWKRDEKYEQMKKGGLKHITKLLDEKGEPKCTIYEVLSNNYKSITAEFTEKEKNKIKPISVHRLLLNTIFFTFDGGMTENFFKESFFFQISLCEIYTRDNRKETDISKMRKIMYWKDNILYVQDKDKKLRKISMIYDEYVTLEEEIRNI